MCEHSCSSTAYQCAKPVCIYSYMDAGYSHWGVAASTMTMTRTTSFRNSHPYLPEENSPPPTCTLHNRIWKNPYVHSQRIKYQDANILCKHPIRMGDAVSWGLQPQPRQLHYEVIWAQPHPIYPITHPHLHRGMMA